MINSIKDIQNLLKSGFTDWKSLGHVSVNEKGSLRIFNYNPRAQFEARWNFFEQVSRGLILDAITGEVIARPFDKFFNWGEGERYSDAPINTVTEKLDGSLGILYQNNGHYRIATRGSFESEQAVWATEYLNKNFNLEGLPSGLTLLFEIIYPDNRVVVDYQGKEDLVLLAARNRVTGEYIPFFDHLKNLAEIYKFSLPKVYQFNTLDQITEAARFLDVNSEGWVVEFLDGQRFKFKGEEYRKLHKLISGLNFKNVLEHVSGGTLDQLLSIVPDEFLDEVHEWIDQIQSTVNQTKQQIEIVFNDAPKDTRKDFALWVMANYKELSPYLFARLDNKPVEPLIYKKAFNND